MIGKVLFRHLWTQIPSEENTTHAKEPRGKKSDRVQMKGKE